MSRQKPTAKKAALTPGQVAFLAAYAQTGNVSSAALAADTDRTIHYDWLKSSKAYRAAFEQAKQAACDFLEGHAWSRATAARHPSDTLLIFLLKGAMPERYRDNAKVEHSGPNGGPIENQITVKFVRPSAG